MKNIQDGKSPETAIVINDSSGEMTASMGEIIDSMFGGIDGCYFVMSETTLEDEKHKNRYKVLFVEDTNGDKHKVFFKIG